MIPRQVPILFLLSSLLLNELTQVIVAGKTAIRGVAPSDIAYYSARTIYCRDGSKRIPVDRVNDDFCDCADGTDEPGTSACALGKFYCANKGHVPLTLFSSRVNDGICDCCDGSDEYGGLVKCANRCAEEGAASRKQLETDVKMFSEGAKIRSELISEAQVNRKQWEEEAKALRVQKEELKAKEDRLLEEKIAIEKAEEEERQKEEKIRKEKEEAEALLRKDTGEADIGEAGGIDPLGSPEDIEALEDAEDFPHGYDNPEGESEGAEYVPETDGEPEESSKHEAENDEELEHEEQQEGEPEEEPFAADSSPEEVEEHSENPPESNEPPSDNFEGLSKEEIGQIIASRWTGGGGSASEKSPPPEPSNDDALNGDDEVHEAVDDFGEENGGEGHAEESDEVLEHSGHDDDDSDEEESDEDEEDEDVDEEDHHHTVPEGASESEKVKANYRRAVQEREKAESKLNKLENKLKSDFGPEGEFTSFADKCFKLTVHQYIYEVCPFNKAIQTENHVPTRLGNWGGFQDNYSKMSFVNGDRCWNGPERSLTVSLECGLKNQLSAVSEPSRCEYNAILTTPNVCSAAKAEELSKSLQAKLQELSSIHDEL